MTPPDEQRIAYERKAIDEARADFAAGRVISEEVMDAWFDLTETGQDAPVPTHEDATVEQYLARVAAGRKGGSTTSP